MEMLATVKKNGTEIDLSKLKEEQETDAEPSSMFVCSICNSKFTDRMKVKKNKWHQFHPEDYEPYMTITTPMNHAEKKYCSIECYIKENYPEDYEELHKIFYED